MQKYILILVGLLTSLNLIGCSHNSTGMKILEERANYSAMNSPNEMSRSPSQRSGSQVKKVWLYPHEMVTGDYFGGAWLYLVVQEDRWSVEELAQ